MPLDKGVEVISVNSLAFKRFLDIARLLKIDVTVVTDNDGKRPRRLPATPNTSNRPILRFASARTINFKPRNHSYCMPTAGRRLMGFLGQNMLMTLPC